MKKKLSAVLLTATLAMTSVMPVRLVAIFAQEPVTDSVDKALLQDAFRKTFKLDFTLYKNGYESLLSNKEEYEELLNSDQANQDQVSTAAKEINNQLLALRLKPDSDKLSAIFDLEAAKARYEIAQAKYDLGSAGFFQYRMDNAKDADEYGAAKLALAIINDKTGDTQLSGTVNLGPYTDPSKEYDAANLENMKAALEMIAESNELRTTDESVAGIKPLQVSDVLMAESQKNINYADTTDAHPGTYGGGENLAVVTGDPFKPWFHVEKAGFENYLKDPNYDPDIAGNRYGHYLNITEENYKVTGFAISKDPAITNGRTGYIQRFSHGGYGVDYDVYYAQFMTYYNSVVNELKDAKAAYEAAQNGTNGPVDTSV